MAHIEGTTGNDILDGDGADDLIEGLAGNDFLGGHGGDDTLLGGDGDDTLVGDVGSDLSDAGSGNDIIVVDADGSDTALGGAGDDFIIATTAGSTGLCRIDGGAGGDHIIVSEQAFLTDFILDGGDGNDHLEIQQARSTRVDLGEGNDWVYIQGGSNQIRLGGGHDLVQFSSALGVIKVTDFAASGASSDSLSLGHLLANASFLGWDKVTNPFAIDLVRVVQKAADTAVQVDFNFGSSPPNWITLAKLKGVQASQLTAANLSGYDPGGEPVLNGVFDGTNKVDHLLGGGGHDVMNGRGGNDLLDGQLGDDVLKGGDGNDELVDSLGGDDRLIGGDGNDSLDARRSTNSGSVNDDRITLDGGAGADQLFHSSLGPQDARVTVLGGAGDDTVALGEAAQALVSGGVGADQIESATAATRIVYAAVADSTAAASDLLKSVSASYLIDLSQIDANTGMANDQAFTLVGALTGAAGQLALRYDSVTDTTFIEGDVDGDGAADLVIRAEHDQTGFANFVL